MTLYEELLAIVDLLNDAGIDYALCGGVAVALHGYPRFTKDIDILVQRQDLAQIKTLVAARGFDLDAGPLPFGVGTDKEREVHRVSKVVGRGLLTLDLLVVTPVFQAVWQDRVSFEIEGRQVKVVSAQGLAVMKRLAGRDQDLLDLRRLGFKGDENDSQE